MWVGVLMWGGAGWAQTPIVISQFDAFPADEIAVVDVVWEEAGEGHRLSFQLSHDRSMSKALMEDWPQIRSWIGHPQLANAFHSEWTLHAVQHGDQWNGVLVRPGLPPLSTDSHPDKSKTTASSCESTGVLFSMPPPQPVSSSLVWDDPAPLRTRTFRLALACTGEYAQFHGGTTDSVLAAMATAVNRANGIFGPELGVQFELIPSNADLVFLNPTTDPYSNVNAAQMMMENEAVLNEIIGEDAYDLGHVFGTGLASIAAASSACGPLKARGVSRSNTPVGDAFVVGQFCHELGHQLGATHTHSNACNAHLETAFEPASGSTIMSYAGLCAPNLQVLCDDEFHGHSLSQMRGFLQSDAGANCPSPEGSINHPPAILLPNTIEPVPPQTPFTLSALHVVDPDFDALTCSWESLDTDEALFRSWPAVPEMQRDLPANAGAGGLGDGLGETLPNGGHDMTFLFTARDNRMTNGGWASDTLFVFTPSESTPFMLTSSAWVDAAMGLSLGWQVAGTDEAPYDDSWLEAWLSWDGGLSYPFPLADSITNTGNALLPWPVSIHGSDLRLKLKPKDGLYFAVTALPTIPEQSAPEADLAVISIVGLTENTCGHAIAPRARVMNLGNASFEGFVVTFELEGTSHVQSFACNEVLAPGQIIEWGFEAQPPDWWTVGYGDWNLAVHVEPLGSLMDMLPDNDALAFAFSTHCGAECPGCGCTSPLACNYESHALYPDGSCVFAPANGSCACQIQFNVSSELGGGEFQTWTLPDLTGIPDSLYISSIMDNTSSAGSWAADLAINLCDPSGNCATLGGYNNVLPGTPVGSWPLSWQMPLAGTYTAALGWPEGLLSGQGEWTISLMNGWNAAGNVFYDVTWGVEGLCTTQVANLGCAGNFNSDDIINITDLLILLSLLECGWDCPDGDITGDGQVNVADLLAFLGVFGESC